MEYDSFGYEICSDTPVGTCSYSGEPIYPWDTVAVFEDGSMVLLEYQYEHMKKLLEPKIIEGSDLGGL